MDLLTDPYLDYLRSLDSRLADAFDKHFNPLAAPFVPSLSPTLGRTWQSADLSKE